MRVTRRSLFGAAAAVGAGTFAASVSGSTPAHAEQLGAPFVPGTAPHLLQAEQLVHYQRLLAAGYLTDGLVGHWPLTATWADRSGRARTLTPGSQGSWTTLRAGGELSLDGKPGAYPKTSFVLDTSDSFTVSAWVLLAETADVTKTYTAVSQDSATATRFLLQHEAGVGWAFKVRGADERDKAAAVATTRAALNTWVHLAGVSHGGTLSLYVNGVLEGTTPTTIAWAAQRDFSIGQATWEGAPVNRWHGSLADVRAYQRALSADEIALIAGRTARSSNFYIPSGPAQVRWGIPADFTTWRSRARCASFVTAVLKHTYPWATDAYFLEHFGDDSPEAAEYRAGFAADPGPRMRRITRVADLRPGDLIAVDYAGSDDDNTGHIVMVRQLKGVYTGSGTHAGETQYAVEIIDCTSDPHGEYGLASYAPYPDTRMIDKNDKFTGTGIGHMMFYASDSTGEFSRYRWSVNTSEARTYPISKRPISAARLL
ncbi:LamG domain-containing protein [Actinoplanes sp. NPDC051346]|uniref:LamG domain-containing protein n=1 Tax=Actinoplanes sp. NPDC051346 TaxID=3155048 RepID=UPI0034353F5B